MLYRLFVDEVGNGDLKGAENDPNIRYLSLTGVLTPLKTHNDVIQPRLDAFKEKLFGHTPDIPVVLHRREIMRREGPFATLRDPGKLDEFNNYILEELHRIPYLVITVQIDKKKHLEQYGVWHFDPYHYCMRCLVERYVMYLKSRNIQGDVVVEARNKSVDKKLKASFARVYSNGTEHIPARIVQMHLTSRDIHMRAKTANVAGLQIADLLAHPSARYMRFIKDQMEQPADFGTKIVDILLKKKYRRCPRTLRVEGFGLKWLP